MVVKIFKRSRILENHEYMKTLQEILAESTCQKRATACYIYDEAGNLLSQASNRCSPSGNVCHRIGVIQTRKNYDVKSDCNWIHAEIMAIRALPEGGARPYRSVLYGHTFYCELCALSLVAIGIPESRQKLSQVSPDGDIKDFHRASKDGICEVCQKTIGEHPPAVPELFLTVMCDGSYVKT